MLKITALANLVLRALRVDSNKVFRDDRRADKMVVDLSKSKELKNEKGKNLTYIGALEEPTFLIPSTKEASNYLRRNT